MQAAGGVVVAGTELPAGVQLGENHLDADQPGAGLDVDRDTATAVGHLYRPICT